MQPQPIPQPIINLSGLSIDEMNTIFAALEELPHKRVSGLIGKMIQQVNLQLNPPPAAPELNGDDANKAESEADAAGAPGLSDPE